MCLQTQRSREAERRALEDQGEVGGGFQGDPSAPLRPFLCTPSAPSSEGCQDVQLQQGVGVGAGLGLVVGRIGRICSGCEGAWMVAQEDLGDEM